MLNGCILYVILLSSANAFMFDFGHNHQQQQRQQPQVSYEDTVLNHECPQYLCPDTQACVSQPLDCPCPFPASQLKCLLPNKRSFVCISKPATGDSKIDSAYDDPVKGPKVKNKGVRDCGWVEDAYKGLV